MANSIRDVPISSSNSRSDGEIPVDMVRVEREVVVFPAHPSRHHRINLTSFDLKLLLLPHAQRGLLYEMPAHDFSSAATRLEQSLSQVLTTFYPLAGRLATSASEGAIYIDCNDAGAAFIEASAENLTIADVMAADVPVAVGQLFALTANANIEGHRVPLLAVQVTKLRDGIFVACSLNHSVVDGASLGHFFSSWAETCSGEARTVPIKPVYDRSTIPSLAGARLNLDPDAEIKRFRLPPLRAKFFHFTKETLKALKDRANSGRESLLPISTLQALCGHVWQAITRARALGPEDPVTIMIAVDCRSRLVPPLPSSYFGNAIDPLYVTSTAWEVARNEVSFPAQLLQDIVQSYDDAAIKSTMDKWGKNPRLTTWKSYEKGENNLLHLGGSHRFKIFETDFGWGRPLAVRGGSASYVDGKLVLFPGRAQDGSVDLEIVLIAPTMEALENDQHFINPLLPRDRSDHSLK